MPQGLYKWEDGAGLKHHCPICQTPLAHDKCKTVCLGNHVEWCHRYHTLFRKNWSSRCSACKTADEQHEKRHREIAELLAKMKKLKAEEEGATMGLLVSPSTPKSFRSPLTTKALHAIDGPDAFSSKLPKATKKERKDAKKAAKALDRDKVVTTTDIQYVARTLHPEVENASGAAKNDTDIESLGEDMEIQLNLKYNNSTCNSKSARHDFIVHDRDWSSVEELEIDRILDAFELDASKTIGLEGELVKELIVAVKKDLVSFHDEIKMIRKNRNAFWRWANKRAYRGLVENGKEWDAKNQWELNSSPCEERGDSELSIAVTTEDERSGNGSMQSSETESADTALTVPSSKAASKSKSPQLKTTTNEASEDGWIQVGKKKLKPAVGKLTLSSNSGLHHLADRPKGRFGALSSLHEASEGGAEGPAAHRDGGIQQLGEDSIGRLA